MKLKEWVIEALSVWAGIDLFLIVLLLYMLRLKEIGWC